MSLFWRQAIAMVLLVTLPLCVAAIAAVGLWRLDRSLGHVAEEYGEVRQIQGIDRELDSAMFALVSDDPAVRSKAQQHLVAAESALVQYLATQYDDIAAETHQASESVHASGVLRRLQELIGEPAASTAAYNLAARVAQLRSDLGELRDDADAGVQGAHDVARAARRSTLTWMIVASVVSTAACVSLLIWSTSSVNRRLRDLHQRLSSQDPNPPEGSARGMGEIVRQIEEINTRMLRKVEESGRELLRRERMMGIGLLAADVAHEINNPMNAMLGLSELGLRVIERGPLDEAARTELQESLRVVRREALRCKSIVERLMAMVRSDRKPGWFDATRLVEETVQVAQAARPDRASCFVITGERVNVLAYGPANDVRQILLTLLINAADAVAADGRIEVDATRTEREVWLRVRDNGRGFTEEMRRTFFTPFQSYSEDGRGTGLGLSIAQALAEGMGAALRPFSEGPGKGSMFILAIPNPEQT